MPLLQTLGNSGASAWGRLGKKLGLYWIIQGFGSGYGVRATSSIGNFYAQTYATTRRLTKNGEHVWSRSLGAGNVEALGIDSSENVYVAGAGYLMLAKFNVSGDLQWQRNLSTNSSDQSQDMHTAANGDCYLAGEKFVGAARYSSLTKVSTNGTVEWSTYNTTDTSSGQGVHYNSVAGTVATLGYYNTGSVYYGIVTVFSATTGAIQWQRTLTYGADSVFAMSAASDSSGNYFVSGMTLGSPRHNFLLKFNSSGSLLWQKRLEIVGVYSYNDYGTVGTDSSGNAYVSFYSDQNNLDAPNYGTGFAKFDPNGNLLLVRKINNKYGTLRLSVSPDGTIGLMGTDLVAKLKGDGSGLGTYSDFTYTSSSLTAIAGSLGVNASGFSFASAGFSATPSSYTVTSSSYSPSPQYIGTEVG